MDAFLVVGMSRLDVPLEKMRVLATVIVEYFSRAGQFEISGLNDQNSFNNQPKENELSTLPLPLQYFVAQCSAPGLSKPTNQTYSELTEA